MSLWNVVYPFCQALPLLTLTLHMGNETDLLARFCMWYFFLILFTYQLVLLLTVLIYLFLRSLEMPTTPAILTETPQCKETLPVPPFSPANQVEKL